MCKINCCLIVSNLVTSELESSMIFILYFKLITKYPHLSAELSFFATVRSPCISISKLTMLTFYFNILMKPSFLLLENTLNCLLLIVYIYGQHQQSKIKHMHHITNINKITSAANQNNRRN